MTTTTGDARIRRIAHVERAVGEDIVVHVDRTDEVVSLTGDTVRVWRSCEGKTFDEVVEQTGLSVDDATAALASLDDAGLLSSPGLSRRQLLTRAGMVAAAAPIVAIALPSAAMADSTAAPTLTAAEGTAANLITLTGAHFTVGQTVFLSASVTPPLGTAGTVAVTPSSVTIVAGGAISGTFTLATTPAVLSMVTVTAHDAKPETVTSTAYTITHN